VHSDKEMRSTLELRFAKEELVISMEFEDVAFKKQKELDVFEQEIRLKVALFIKVVTSDRRNKGDSVFSNEESVRLRDPELTAIMKLLEGISVI